MDITLPKVILSIALATLLPVMPAHTSKDNIEKENIPHSRQKRILWITNDGRLALPPGTTMVISPSISMPFVRHPPEGFLSNMTVSLPFTIDFDKLGLTDNENPYGTLPPLFARSFGRATGSLVADYLGQYVESRRSKRSSEHNGEFDVPEEIHNFVRTKLHGGERVLLYPMAEDFIANFGLPGKPCILRAICEIHVHPLTNFGFLGEILKLFLTPSISEYSNLLEEYVEAETVGKTKAECFPYYKECPKSIFRTASHIYKKSAETEHESEATENEMLGFKFM